MHQIQFNLWQIKKTTIPKIIIKNIFNVFGNLSFQKVKDNCSSIHRFSNSL
ncbi:Uncharacterised protein [Klebsiella pneumoniae]|nr:Uncharacterised protein [Klebsiella pneumoniae]